jgi:hypothetical protein
MAEQKMESFVVVVAVLAGVPPARGSGLEPVTSIRSPAGQPRYAVLGAAPLTNRNTRVQILVWDAESTSHIIHELDRLF